MSGNNNAQRSCNNVVANKPYVDKDDLYKPQWYAELVYMRNVPFKEAYYDNAIGTTLDSFQAYKRRIKLEELIRSKKLYEAFRAKALNKQQRASWRDNVNRYIP